MLAAIADAKRGAAEDRVAVEWPGEAIRAALPPTVQVSLVAESEDARRISIHRAPRETRG